MLNYMYMYTLYHRCLFVYLFVYLNSQDQTSRDAQVKNKATNQYGEVKLRTGDEKIKERRRRME